MRLSFDAARMHVRASAHFARRLKGRHQGGGRRGAAQSAGAQRATAGGRASLGRGFAGRHPVGFLDRFMRAMWQRLQSHAQTLGQLAPAPPTPLCPPVLRVAWVLALPRVVTYALDGARPYLLRAHAQARWRGGTGWA